MAEPSFDIQVRAARPDDWQAFYDMRDEPAVRYNTLGTPFINPTRSRERFTAVRDHEWSLIAEAVYPDAPPKQIGQLSLFRGTYIEFYTARFGIHVATAFQGMGVGSALMAAMCDLTDNWLNLHRVELEVFTDNEAGLALYRKFGFEIEATMTRYAFRDGAFTDAYKMGRINPHHLKG